MKLWRLLHLNDIIRGYAKSTSPMSTTLTSWRNPAHMLRHLSAPTTSVTIPRVPATRGSALCWGGMHHLTRDPPIHLLVHYVLWMGAQTCVRSRYADFTLLLWCVARLLTLCFAIVMGKSPITRSRALPSIRQRYLWSYCLDREARRGQRHPRREGLRSHV